MRRTTILLMLTAVAFVAGGCLDDSITGTRDVSITLTATSTTAGVNEAITVDYEATGTGLLSVVLDWGDGESETILLSGTGISAGGILQHSYSAPGTYTVTGTTTASNGTASSELTVQIS